MCKDDGQAILVLQIINSIQHSLFQWPERHFSQQNPRPGNAKLLDSRHPFQPGAEKHLCAAADSDFTRDPDFLQPRPRMVAAPQEICHGVLMWIKVRGCDEIGDPYTESLRKLM